MDLWRAAPGLGCSRGRHAGPWAAASLGLPGAGPPLLPGRSVSEPEPSAPVLLPTLRPGGLFASRNAIHQKQGKKTNFLFPSPSLTPLLLLQETMGCSEHFAGGRSIYRPAERAGRTMSRTSSAWSGLFQFAQLCSVRARGV